ncbi:MAG: leuC [Rhodospirillales bacterium]|nr:leuC [Rhodospirillales bacterium]
MAGRQSIFDKIWQRHAIADLGDGFTLLHVDRHVVCDLTGKGFVELEKRGGTVRNPELTFAVADHSISTDPENPDPRFLKNDFVVNLRRQAARFGFTHFDIGERGHGIEHVVAPELGIVLPGLTVACADSHTVTLGAMGAIAWGIGQSELVHILATQCSVQRKPKRMRIRLDGTLPPGVYAKDLILHLIGQTGTGAGTGHAVELCGTAIDALGMEGRFTMCNMTIELGARFGMIAPDETTFAYLAGRPYAPQGALWDRAIADWRTLASDAGAEFDVELSFNVSAIAPQVTWGTNPGAVLPIGGCVPDPANEADVAALDYMGLTPGTAIEGLPIDWVFIGSCTNSRISDLREAAAIVGGRKVAPNVRAWVVPGSTEVKLQAEAEHLDAIFRAAGFEWREPGCSMCLAANGDLVPRGMRAVSTSNRNFVGRQGPGSRTHLASPALAAASACLGVIADPRKLRF